MPAVEPDEGFRHQPQCMHETSINKSPGLWGPLRVDLCYHLGVLPTDNTEHILTDLTSVRLGKTNTCGSNNTNVRDTALAAVRKMGQ